MKTDVKANRFKPRWRKILYDLWGDKTRTALVVSSIAVGVFAVGMIIAAFTILNQDINSGYAATHPVNVDVYTAPFYEDLLRVIKKQPGVNTVEGRQILNVRARKGSGNWQAVKLIGISDFGAAQINQVNPLSGNPVPEQGQIVLSDSVIKSTGFQVGDVITLELPDGSNQSVNVVGLVSDQQLIQPDGGDVISNGFMTIDTLRSFGLGDHYNRLLLTVASQDAANAALIAQVAAGVEDKLVSRNQPVFHISEKTSKHPMADTFLALMGLLGALGLLITVLSASLIVNTLNAMLTQQLRQIGVMKLIGARSIQILGMYLGLILAYSLIALLIAVPLGAWAGYGLASMVTGLLGGVMGDFRIVPAAIIVQVLIAFLVPLAAGFAPVYRGAKINVRRAISDYRPSGNAGRQGLLNRSGPWVRWISRPILLSFRNTFRKKGRLALTIFTLTIAGAVFIGVFNVRATMDSVMDQVMQHFLGDVTITFSQPYSLNKVQRDLMVVPGVKAIEGWGGVAAEILDHQGDVVTNLNIVTAPHNSQLLDPEIVAGRWLEPYEKKAMVIADSIYSLYPDLQPGDSILVRIGENREDAWQVVGVFAFVSMMGDPMAYADFDYVANKIYAPNQANSFRVTTSYTGDDLQGLIQSIEQQLDLKAYEVQSIQAGYVTRQSAGTAINTLIIFLLVMAMLTAIVGSVGLMGTMSINVLERTREIGVMRTIGAVDAVVMQAVMIEGLVICLITWLLAIVLAIPISNALLGIIGQAMSGSAAAFGLIFTPSGVFTWLVVVIVLSIIASVIPARNAARLTINEVLAYE